jgi:uncharacterized membrane protein
MADGQEKSEPKTTSDQTSGPSDSPEPEIGTGTRLPTAPTPTPTPVDPVTEKKLRETVEAALGSEVRPNVRARVAARVVQQVEETVVFQGPIPPPGYLDGYEKACPGSATRILAMAERAQEALIERRSKQIDYEYGDRQLGMHYGFYGLIALLIASIIIIALGQIVLGTSLLGATIVGKVISTFVHGRPSATPAPQPPSVKAEPNKAEPSKAANETGYWQRLWAAIRGR